MIQRRPWNLRKRLPAHIARLILDHVPGVDRHRPAHRRQNEQSPSNNITARVGGCDTLSGPAIPIAASLASEPAACGGGAMKNTIEPPRRQDAQENRLGNCGQAIERHGKESVWFKLKMRT